MIGAIISAISAKKSSGGTAGKVDSSGDNKLGEKVDQGISKIADAASAAKINPAVGSHVPLSFQYSDENLKTLFGQTCPIDCFSKINSYMFKYKDEVQDKLSGDYGIDDDIHYGVMAQDLEANPFTRSTVKKDPETGLKIVDTKELTMANTAAISDIMKELKELREFKKSVLAAIGEGA